MTQRSLFLLVLITILSVFFVKDASFSYTPEQNRRVITIEIELKGSYQDAIEEIITNPMEEKLYTLEGIKKMYSLSEDEKSVITLFFHDDMDLNQAYLKVRDVVERVYAGYPERTQKPRILKSNSDSFPVFILMLKDTAGMDEEKLKKMFQGVSGAGQIDVGGAPRKDVILRTDSKILSQYQISDRDIAGVIGKDNRIVSVPVRPGYTLTGDFRYIGLDGFSSQPLAEGLTLGDVIKPVWEDAPTGSLSRVNGEDSTLIWVRKAGDANTIKLCRDLNTLLTKLPESQVLYDRGALIEASLKSTAGAILTGIAAVLLCTGFFLGSFRNAFLLSLNIPFSVCGALAVLTLLGRDIDMMVLSGIAVGTGMVIDGGIVLLEGGIEQSRKPVFYSLLSTLLVFSSLLFAPISVQELYSGMVWAVSLVLIISMIYLFLILPGLMQNQVVPHSFLSYLPIEVLLTHLMRFRWGYGSAMILFSGICLFYSLQLPIQQDMILEDSTLQFSIEYPSGTTKEAVSEDLRVLEDTICQWDEIDFFSSDFRPEKAVFNLKIKKDEENKKEELIARVQNINDQFTGSLFFSDSTVQQRYDVTLLSYDRRVLYQAGDELSRYFQHSGIGGGVIMHYKQQQPLIRLLLEPTSLSLFNLLPSSIFQQVSGYLSRPVRVKWQPAVPIWKGQDSYDVRVVRGASESPVLSGLKEFPIRTEDNSSLPLDQIAQWEDKNNYGRIFHYNGLRGISISVLYDSKDSRQIRKKVDSLLGNIKLPPNVRVRHGEQMKQQMEVARSMIFCVIFSVLLVFLLLIYVFESFRIPLFLFLQIPVALLFPMGGLYLLHIPLSAPVFFALILVIGVSVNNGIVLFSGIKEKKMDFAEIQWAFRKHSVSLITALITTVAGMVPMFFTGASGNSQLLGLTITVCLGLISSILVLMVFTPFLLCGKHRK